MMENSIKQMYVNKIYYQSKFTQLFECALTALFQ